MRQEQTMHERKSAAKRYGTGTAVATLIVVTAAVLMFFRMFGLVRIPFERLDDRIVTQVFRKPASKNRGAVGLVGEDSAEEEEAAKGQAAGLSAGDRASAQPLYAGDRMTASVTIPETGGEEESLLCFAVRGSTVRILVDGEERAAFGTERLQAGKQIGDLLIELPLGAEDAGKTLQAEVSCVEGKTASVLSDVLVLKETDAAKYPLIGHESKFMALTSILLAAVMLFVYAIISGVVRRHFTDTFLLAIALFLMGCAVYGRSLFFYLLLHNEEICTNAGLIAGFAAPAACDFYLWRATAARKKVRRRIYLVLALVYTGAFAGLAVLNVMHGIHFAEFDIYLIYAVAVNLLLVVLTELLAGSHKGKEEDGLLRGGAVIGLILFLIELARQNLWRLEESSTFGQYFPRGDYIAGAVLVLSCLMLMHQYRRYAGAVRREENAALMKRLSYTDILSGIPNRHYCDRKLAEISKHVDYTRSPVEYTLFMLNVDAMHETNEKYGFETGNELIRCVAEAIHDAMRGCGADVRGDLGPVYGNDLEEIPETEEKEGADGILKGETADCFFGRWGGDEFVACTFRSQADAFQTTFAGRIAAINIEKRLPLAISVAVGSSDFRSGSHDAVMKALGNAEREISDRRMG